MNRAALLVGLALTASGAPTIRAAEPAPAPAPTVADEAVVALPPMFVRESGGKVDWVYLRDGRDEYLSRVSLNMTQEFVESRARQLFRLRAIVPDRFLAELPSVTVLYDEALKPKADDEVARDIWRNDKAAPAAAKGRSRVMFLPNLGLDGRDLSALFAYVGQQGGFETKELAITSGFLRFRLERRTPMLPPWLVEGILAAHADMLVNVKVREEGFARDVRLRPFIWLSEAESRALAADPLRPRSLLAANEMFAADAWRGEGNPDPRRRPTLQAQVALFVRWALDPRHQVREAFWTFAQRASEERVTEELFSRCFGFGFATLRDRLHDYLPVAVKGALRLDAGDEPSFAAERPAEAKPADVARLRGEWERLEIAYVRRNHPGLLARYVSQARTTLRTAYEDDYRAPPLLLTLGLCEIDAGDPPAGVPLLEAAMAAGASRPSACYEVARFRFAALARGEPASRMFFAVELAAVVEPLRQAIKQTPQLPEVYGLLADAWTRAREAPPASDLDALARGGKLFAMNPAVSYRIALALARHGRRAEAVDLLATSLEYATDDALRARMAQLQSALERSGN